MGHSSSDGTSMSDRLLKFGVFGGLCSENISYGPNDGWDIVKGLFIDDGVPSRGHRHNLFNPNVKVIGVGCGTHKVYRNMCV